MAALFALTLSFFCGCCVLLTCSLRCVGQGGPGRGRALDRCVPTPSLLLYAGFLRYLPARGSSSPWPQPGRLFIQCNT